jgi:hypothetical protein
VSVALLQICDGQFGFEVLVATREMQAAITAGRAQRIARVRVVAPSLCDGGWEADWQRQCHVNCARRGCCREVSMGC